MGNSYSYIESDQNSFLDSIPFVRYIRIWWHNYEKRRMKKEIDEMLKKYGYELDE